MDDWGMRGNGVGGWTRRECDLEEASTGCVWLVYGGNGEILGEEVACECCACVPSISKDEIGNLMLPRDSSAVGALSAAVAISSSGNTLPSCPCLHCLPRITHLQSRPCKKNLQLPCPGSITPRFWQQRS